MEKCYVETISHITAEMPTMGRRDLKVIKTWRVLFEQIQYWVTVSGSEGSRQIPRCVSGMHRDARSSYGDYVHLHEQEVGQNCRSLGEGCFSKRSRLLLPYHGMQEAVSSSLYLSRAQVADP